MLVSSKTTSTPSKSPLRKTKKVGPGRPLLKKPRKARKPLKEREGYTEADMMEAICLVREEEFSIKAASRHLNSNKQNEVPRMTLSDRLKSRAPKETPSLGRPQEWNYCY